MQLGAGRQDLNLAPQGDRRLKKDMIQTQPESTVRTMKITAMPIIILLSLTASGCGLLVPPDPCADGSPLFAGLTTEQKDACSECGATECSSGETGETGGENQADLTCEQPVKQENGQWVADPLDSAFCLVGEWATGNPGDHPFPDLIHRAAQSCVALTAPYPCRREWALPPDSQGQECVMCDPLQDTPLATRTPLATNAGWSIYKRSEFFPEWYPSISLDTGAPMSEWAPDLDPPLVNVPPDPEFVCPGGMLSIKTGGDSGGHPVTGATQYTCICDGGGDELCQPGYVCEAGKVMTLENIVKSTICTYDDGTSNGAVPNGPPNYGLDSWADGISVRGPSVTITTSMLLEAWEGAGVLDDGQRWEVIEAGTTDVVLGITECEAGSLCEYLGLGVGEEILVPADAPDYFELGLAIPIEITRIDGGVDYMTLQVGAL